MIQWNSASSGVTVSCYSATSHPFFSSQTFIYRRVAFTESSCILIIKLTLVSSLSVRSLTLFLHRRWRLDPEATTRQFQIKIHRWYNRAKHTRCDCYFKWLYYALLFQENVPYRDVRICALIFRCCLMWSSFSLEPKGQWILDWSCSDCQRLTPWCPVIRTFWQVSFSLWALWVGRLDYGPSILSSASPSVSNTVDTQ